MIEATHIRTEIRQAIATALQGIGPLVHPGRLDAIDTSNMPAILIYARSEEVDLDSRRMGSKVLDRVLDLSIDIYDAGNEHIDHQLDALAAMVEQRIDACGTFEGLMERIELISTEIEKLDDTETSSGVCHMIWQITYRTHAGKPAGQRL